MIMKSEKRSKDILDKYFNEVCGDKGVKEELIQNLSKMMKNVPSASSNNNMSDVDEHFDKVVEVSKKGVGVNIQPDIAEKVENSIKIYKEKENPKNKQKSFNVGAVKSGSKKNYPLDNGTVITRKDKDEGSVNKYKIVKFLKQGGFGMTYLATRVGENEGEFVVIKEFCPNPTNRNLPDGRLDIDYTDVEISNQLKSFISEPDRTKGLNNVVNMNLVRSFTSAFEYKFGDNDEHGNWYYVMEYVPGNSLRDIMQSFEDDATALVALPYKSRFKIMDQLCNALQNLHNIGCVHQDISPNNMIISFDSVGNPNLRVIDFGLATGLNHTNKESISIVKTYGTKGFCDSLDIKIYAALQEEGKGEKLKLLDVYSLGAVLGYLFLEYIESIKDSKFGDNYQTRLQNMRPKQDLTFDENDSLEFKALKSQLFLIHNLVCQATVKNLDERINSVESFRTYLNLIEKIDANFIQNLEAKVNLEVLVDNREGDSYDINSGGQGVNNAGKDDVVKVTENEDKKSDKEPYKPSGIKSFFNKIKTKWYVIFSVLVVGLIMVFVITRPEPPITIEYLNEVFIAAQQNDSVAKQRIKEIIDDKVKINYIEGETLFYTYDLSTFLARGNNEYIIGKTHKINRFNTGPDGKVITIVLEELN